MGKNVFRTYRFFYWKTVILCTVLSLYFFFFVYKAKILNLKSLFWRFSNFIGKFQFPRADDLNPPARLQGQEKNRSGPWSTPKLFVRSHKSCLTSEHSLRTKTKDAQCPLATLLKKQLKQERVLNEKCQSHAQLHMQSLPLDEKIIQGRKWTIPTEFLPITWKSLRDFTLKKYIVTVAP